jgi:hypothetical protein
MEHEHDKIAQLEQDLYDGKIQPDVAWVMIWSKQWRMGKLHQKRYGDHSSVEVNQTFDVADRIIARWKENLKRLNEEDPLPKVIEGKAVDVTPE